MYRSVSADRSGLSYRWARRGGNLPHGDPKLARMGVRQTSREWAGYTTTQVTAEEEGLVEPLWGASMAADAEAAGETAVITAEDAAVVTSILEGAVVTVSWWACAAAFATAAVAAYATYEAVEAIQHSRHVSRDRKAAQAAAQMHPTEAPQEHPMAPISNRGRIMIESIDHEGNLVVSGTQPSQSQPMDYTQSIGLGKRKYSEISEDIPRGPGDFSGLVRTFLNPVTSRIIRYKGIRRNRKFAALEQYSPFWKKHNRLSADTVMIAPSQA